MRTVGCASESFEARLRGRVGIRPVHEMDHGDPQSALTLFAEQQNKPMNKVEDERLQRYDNVSVNLRLRRGGGPGRAEPSRMRLRIRLEESDALRHREMANFEDERDMAGRYRRLIGRGHRQLGTSRFVWGLFMTGDGRFQAPERRGSDGEAFEPAIQ